LAGVHRGRGENCRARDAWFGFTAARSTRTLDMTIIKLCGVAVRLPPIIMVALPLVGCNFSESIPFDSTAWKNGDVTASTRNEAPRLRMADDLVKDEVLIGKSKSDIEAMLGPPTKTDKFSNYGLVYWLGPERGFMSIDSEWVVVELDHASVAIHADIVRD
jgi:hypothetical protein